MLQLSCFPYQPPAHYRPDPRFVVVRDGTTFERAVRELWDRPALTFDFETSGLAWYQHARACGVALGCVHANGYIQNYYVPFRHDTGEQQLDIETIGPAIKALLERPDTLKVGHHLKFDMHIAIREGWYPAGPRYDTMIAAQFFDENRPIALKERAFRDLRDPDAGFWESEVDKEILRLAKSHRLGKEAYLHRYGYSQLPVELCGIYAAHDTEFTTRLWGFYEQNQISQRYPRVWQTEMDLIEVLVDMEETGVPVDTFYLQSLRERVTQARDQLDQQIAQWTYPYRVDVGSDEELRRYLMGVLKLPLSKLTKAKKLSVDREVLESFKEASPVIPLIMDRRDADKIATTYTGSILDRLDSSNILHCDFQQVGTNTGRLACREPNLQNIPTDDDDRAKAATGKKLKEGGVDPWSVKRAFKIPNGYRRLFADYSQIELRVLAYYSGDAIMREVYQTGGDIHTRTSLEVFHTDDETMRRRAKVINFGLSYCMSAKGFARQTKVSIQDAEKYLGRFFERYHGIAAYRPYFWDLCRSQGNQFVNRFGRPRRLANLSSYDEYERARAERQAIGSLVQGTAAELTKESLVRIYRWIKEQQVPAKLCLTIHDEIQLDVDVRVVDQVAKWIHYHMERYPEFQPIPILVDIAESATFWNEKQKMKTT